MGQNAQITTVTTWTADEGKIHTVELHHSYNLQNTMSATVYFMAFLRTKFYTICVHL